MDFPKVMGQEVRRAENGALLSPQLLLFAVYSCTRFCPSSGAGGEKFLSLSLNSLGKWRSLKIAQIVFFPVLSGNKIAAAPVLPFLLRGMLSL